MSDLKNTPITFSFEGMDRLFRAHGHTLHDVGMLRAGQFLRIPDVVVWPGKVNQNLIINQNSFKNKLNKCRVP